MITTKCMLIGKIILRKLLDGVYNFLPKMYQGATVEEFPKAVDLTVHTKAPGKWLLIDLETGQEYIGLDVPTKYGRWRRIKDVDNRQ
jgi:hypothetical protein